LKVFAAMMNEAPLIEKEATETASLWKKFLAALGLSSSLRLIGGLAAILLIASVSAVVIMNRSRSEKGLRQVVDSAAAERNQPASKPHENGSPASPTLAENTERQRSAQQRGEAILALNLTELSEDSRGPTLSISPATEFIELGTPARRGTEITIPTEARYGANLTKEGGGSRNLGTRKASASGFVVYRVPVSQLKPGVYHLEVYSVPPGDDDLTMKYRFTVRQ
jgi:hypothetical protein